jgi:formylglycine-generating enzyme required for sulfatase activity
MHPVCGVNWGDAKAFCEWLTRKERAEGKISSEQSYRLPRDWEWSVAVGLNESRSGTPKDKHAKIRGVYPWGAEWPPPAGAGNYAGDEAKDGNRPANFGTIAGHRDRYARTSPVGSFNANQFGLYDMGGNVWQWCEDWYDAEQEYRVLRGASWDDLGPEFLLSSCRDFSSPVYRKVSLGFRCVLVVGGSAR